MSELKIARIDVFQVNLPFSGGVYRLSAGREYRGFDATIVRVTTQNGIEGWGESTPFGSTYVASHALGVRAGIAEIAPRLIGLDPRRVDRINDAMDEALVGHLHAKTPIDVACWDIFGKWAGLPVCELLGGRTDVGLPIISSIYVGEPEEMRARVAAHRARGYIGHSIKIDGEPSADAARIAASLADKQPGAQKKELLCVISEFLLMGKTKPTSPEVNNFRFYLPGSLSQIVLHAAPGYEPLPKPCSFLYSDHSQSLDMVEGLKMSGEESRSSDSFGTNDPDTLSGSLNEESASIYSSRHSFSGSDNNGDAGSGIEVDDDTGPLIQLSDVGISYNKQKGSDETSPTSFADDLGGLMSKRALESWLDDQPGLTDLSLSKQSSGQTSSARISLRDVKGSIKRKSYTLLDPANGNGLRVDYSFSSEVSSISPLLVCVEISFQNSSTEPLTNISLMNDESNQVPDSTGQGEDSQESSLTAQYLPTIVPVEEISSLAPGQTIKRTLQVHFHHHLLPIELDLWCTGKKHPVKLRPDIGYFVKPLPMDVEDFKKRESQLPGMFEYSRTCNFTDHIEELNKETDNSSPMKDKLLVICQSLASKILSHANIFLVSIDMPVAANLDDASGLCLRFSCEILSKSIPCLITVTIEGKFHEPLNARVKVNCEETVFGLNLLNRVVTFLS